MTRCSGNAVCLAALICFTPIWFILILMICVFALTCLGSVGIRGFTFGPGELLIGIALSERFALGGLHWLNFVFLLEIFRWWWSSGNWVFASWLDEWIAEWWNEYCFESVDGNMIWKFDVSQESDKIIVFFVSVEMHGDQLSQRMFVSGDESIFMIDEQSVAEIVHFFLYIFWKLLKS